MAASGPTWEAEERALADGRQTVAGCDEAGRGPLAGPVVSAAVVLPREADLPGLNDSKKLTPESRDALYRLIRGSGAAVGVGLAGPADIDRMNILQASLLSMRRAIADLGIAVDLVLVDGNQRVPGLVCAQELLVRGDSRSVSIAAASIIAKVTRDRILERLDRLYPGYGFAGNKGYPSPDHLEALRRLGPCPVHRTCYAPVRAMLDRPPPLPPARSRPAVQLPLFAEDDVE